MPFGQILFFLILVTVPLSGTATDLDKAVDLRKTEQFSKAEQLLKKYSSPAKFDSMNPMEKIEFLRGLLELAHIRALATFIYSAAPRKWTSSDRVSLKNAFIVSSPPGIAISDYDHILFVVTGSDSGNALAWGELGGKYMWIYTSTNYKYVVAHELGHNYGLDDQYTSNSGNVTMGDDKYNLMNAVNSSIQSEQFRLRKSQWTTIK